MAATLLVAHIKIELLPLVDMFRKREIELHLTLDNFKTFYSSLKINLIS